MATREQHFKGNAGRGADTAQIVVRTEKERATVISGGSYLGVKDGETMPCSEVMARCGTGISVLYNPKDSYSRINMR